MYAVTVEGQRGESEQRSWTGRKLERKSDDGRPRTGTRQMSNVKEQSMVVGYDTQSA